MTLTYVRLLSMSSDKYEAIVSHGIEVYNAPKEGHEILVRLGDAASVTSRYLRPQGRSRRDYCQDLRRLPHRRS